MNCPRLYGLTMFITEGIRAAFLVCVFIVLNTLLIIWVGKTYYREGCEKLYGDDLPGLQDCEYDYGLLHVGSYALVILNVVVCWHLYRRSYQSSIYYWIVDQHARFLCLSVPENELNVVLLPEEV